MRVSALLPVACLAAIFSLGAAWATLLHSGETPKDARINPAGGHMGRESHGWTDPVIFKRVTVPWLLRALDVRVE